MINEIASRAQNAGERCMAIMVILLSFADVFSKNNDLNKQIR